MLRDNLKFSELSGMCVPSDATAGILPHLSDKSVNEIHVFLIRPLVEAALLAASLTFVLMLLY